MNHERLQQHLAAYRKKLAQLDEKMLQERADRAERVKYYQGWTAERLATMTEEAFYQYVAKLWAMLIWGNKQYVVDRLIANNGMDTLRAELANLVWGSDAVAARWDRFRGRIKGMGPATISEILAHVHPDTCALWNRRAYVGLNYLEVAGLPRHDYQLTGKKYVELCGDIGKIADAMREAGIDDHSLLAADYFIWEELQVEDNLSALHAPKKPDAPADLPDKLATVPAEVSEFIHDDVRDKLAEVGEWLGFKAYTEVKVADGARVDTIWESTIGNMGRVIYVFEVQTHGSIDSLMMNLLKALNNPAVQGVVAVSDAAQIEKIRKHAAPVKDLAAKVRFWEYTDVLDTHERLQAVNESINGLRLVPEGF